MNALHTKRLFVGLPITPDPALGMLLARLKNSFHQSRINWVKLQNLHLTLKFLGETPVDMIPALNEALGAVASQHQAFAYSFDKCGVFGSRYDPRVIWVGAESYPEAMKNLAHEVLNACALAGFPRDRQNFVPHLTLGRIKKLADKSHFQDVMRHLPAATYQQLSVNEFHLYESELHPTGSEYTILSTFRLCLPGEKFKKNKNI
jgi:RNA 2',3'-cyclic 3'-phosphodiesterase